MSNKESTFMKTEAMLAAGPVLRNANSNFSSWFQEVARIMVAEDAGKANVLAFMLNQELAKHNIKAERAVIDAAPQLLKMLQRIVDAESRMSGNNPVAGLCDEARDLIAKTLSN